MSRFQELYRIPKRLYPENGFIVIEAAALQKDMLHNRVLAHIKFLNISDRIINACKVSITAIEFNKTDIIDTITFSYLDLNVHKGENFGSKTPIYLPDNTRIIRIVIDEISLSNGKINSYNSLIEIPNQQLLEKLIINHNLLEQYSIEINAPCKYVPMEWKNLFLCTCGMINEKGINCSRCGNNFYRENKYMDTRLLQANYLSRLEKNQQSIQTKSQAKKRLTKIIIITTSLILMIIMGLILRNELITKPYEQKYLLYEEASSLYEQKNI